MVNAKVLRDVFIEKLYERMFTDDSIFFISADFGAPVLDKLRSTFSDRFINVGIAEQNLVNVATGLALEGFKSYVYAIAPFLSMRAYEQIRTSISILSPIRDININLISVGAGLSYDVTGPTHHCLEDSCIMNVLPNFLVFSPSDPVLSERFVDYTLQHSGPKYIRMDGKAQPVLYKEQDDISFEQGLFELQKGTDICIVSTGYMTHLALKIAAMLSQENISVGVIDIFLLKPLNKKRLLKILSGYQHIVTMEEGFINKGGLDSVIESLCFENKLLVGMTKVGFEDKYVFDVGNREHLYKVNKLDQESIIKTIKADLNKCFSPQYSM
jgi:transketolase